MAENSKIEWCDHTFNPWVGCTKVSPACDNCYAESWAKRTGQSQLWQGDRRRTSAANWQQPLKWNRQAEREGRRFRVFCASLADVFDNQVADEWRVDLWKLIRDTPHLDWLLLTKRPQNIAKMLPGPAAGYDSTISRLLWRDGWKNVWLGTTAENQKQLAVRAWHLSQVPAAVRFLSCEPLLSGLNFQATNRWGTKWDVLTGRILDAVSGPSSVGGVSWIIAGGESGPGARPMHPDWARSLRDQCAAAGVPFFMKQWGEWVGLNDFCAAHCGWWNGLTDAGRHAVAVQMIEGRQMMRLGKNRAGRLLDGREHNEFPANA
jgi:protein gp37